MSAIHDRSVHVSLDISNHESKAISAFDVIMSTSSSMAGYTFDVRAEPGQSRHVDGWQLVSDRGENPKSRLGPISSCSVHLITYGDGSSWTGPSPF